LIKIFTSLLGGPVRFWNDQVFVKPANDGGVVAWHQDYSYWTRTKPIAHLTAWIALDDSDEENGCVQYVPGSHRWKLLPKVGLANKMDDIFEVLQEQQKREFQPVPSVLKTGQASFHHSLILHGSYENRSDRPRRGVVVNVFRDGVISDSDEPLLEGVPAIPKGDKIDGQFFPLLTPKNPDNPSNGEGIAPIVATAINQIQRMEENMKLFRTLTLGALALGFCLSFAASDTFAQRSRAWRGDYQGRDSYGSRYQNRNWRGDYNRRWGRNYNYGRLSWGERRRLQIMRYRMMQRNRYYNRLSWEQRRRLANRRNYYRNNNYYNNSYYRRRW
jgi:hypothetical protein